MDTPASLTTLLPTSAADCTPDCPVRRCALLIEGKWTTQIVRDLLPGKKRYSELLAGLPGISPKVLAERLRLLERHGVLRRQVYAEVPPRTEYELTELGQALREVIAAMAAFGVRLGTPPALDDVAPAAPAATALAPAAPASIFTLADPAATGA